MAKKERKYKKAGMPPGTLVHIGKRRAEEVRLRLLEFDAEGINEEDVKALEELAPPKDKKSITWINVSGVHDVKVLEGLGSSLGLHPLVCEDIVNTEQRPKVEYYKDYLFVVLKFPRTGTQGVESEQVSLVLGPNYVVTFQEGEKDTFWQVKERIEKTRARFFERGADYLAYALMDVVVDNYFVVIETFSEKIEFLEEKLLVDARPETLHEIHALKRNLIYLRKTAWPAREVINGLVREDSELIKDSVKIYLRDVYDHVVQIIDTIDTYRDIVSGMHESYLSIASNRMNEIMKVLTMVATVFIPVTFIAGVYGMNFKYMPELDMPWAYPVVVLVMALVGLGIILLFKKKRWI
jgi:magnesium transporter